MLTQSELKLIEGVSKARSELQSTVAEKDSLERDLARSLAEVDSLKQDLDTVLLLCLVSFCALFLPHKHTRPSQGLSLSIDVRVDRLYVRGWIGCGWIGCMCARVEGSYLKFLKATNIIILLQVVRMQILYNFCDVSVCYKGHPLGCLSPVFFFFCEIHSLSHSLTRSLARFTHSLTRQRKVNPSLQKNHRHEWKQRIRQQFWLWQTRSSKCASALSRR
jgi:hypothetical protein